MVEERRRTATSALERIESLSTEAAKRVDSLQNQIHSAAAEKVQREAENLQIADRLQALSTEKAAAEATGVQLQHESDQVRARIAEIDQELKIARSELDAARERKSELGAQLAKLQSDLAYMGESCINELGIPADELRANTEIVMVEGEQLTLEETAYREMRTKLDNMGPVNMMALEEFKETSSATSSWRRSARTCWIQLRTRRQRSKRLMSSPGRSSRKPLTGSMRTSSLRSANCLGAARPLCA